LAKLTDVQSVGPLVFVLEVALKGVVTTEVSFTKWTFLRFIDPSTDRWRYLKYPWKRKITIAGATPNTDFPAL